MEVTATSLLVSIATNRALPVVVLPRLMGSVGAKTVAPLTCCARVSWAVVKLQATVVPSAVPTTSVTVPDTVVVQAVPSASGGVGVRVAMVPGALSVTVAGTFAAAPAARRVKVAVVIVAAFMGLLNVALTVVLSGTLTAPFGGAWAVTVGRTSVVKLHTTVAPIAVPITSVPVPVTSSASDMTI